MAVPIPNCAHAIKKGGIKEIHQPMLGMKPMKNARMPHSAAKGIPNKARMSVSPTATMKLITVMILTYWRTSTGELLDAQHGRTIFAQAKERLIPQREGRAPA